MVPDQILALCITGTLANSEDLVDEMLQNIAFYQDRECLSG